MRFCRRATPQSFLQRCSMAKRKGQECGTSTRYGALLSFSPVPEHHGLPCANADTLAPWCKSASFGARQQIVPLCRVKGQECTLFHKCDAFLPFHNDVGQRSKNTCSSALRQFPINEATGSLVVGNPQFRLR